jgi:hypothetical protein
MPLVGGFGRRRAGDGVGAEVEAAAVAVALEELREDGRSGWEEIGARGDTASAGLESGWVEGVGCAGWSDDSAATPVEGSASVTPVETTRGSDGVGTASTSAMVNSPASKWDARWASW